MNFKVQAAYVAAGVKKKKKGRRSKERGIVRDSKEREGAREGVHRSVMRAGNIKCTHARYQEK